MASLERTAYPRFKRLISERELREFFTPSAEDVAWARERTHDRPGRVLALLVMLKSAARLGRVPKLGEIPEVVVAQVRDQAGLAAGTVPEADSERSEERYRTAVRERLELKHRPGEARAVAEAVMRSVGEMKDIAEPRRTAMTVCLLAQVQAAARDETVVMLSKRMSRHLKRAQEKLLEIEKRQKETTGQLLATFRDVLTALRESGEAAPGAWEGEASLDDLLALKNARAAIEAAGGFEAQMAELEALDAYRGSNYTALVERFFKPDRPTMFKIARCLTFTATSTDRSVLDALDHVLAHQHLTRPLVADTHPTRKDENGELVRLDLSFVPKMWLKTVYSREEPGMLVRRHFEAMVFACLVEELRCGDVAVIGAEDYGDWTRMLLPWEQCEPKLAGFCQQAGIPATASEFTVRLRERLTMIAETVDAGYPDNKDLTIDPVTGAPSLVVRRAGERTASAEKLEEALSERLPARSVLEHLA
ncbi:DUF4158 domain-containing protein, partial [Streptomyces albiflaviniger]|nr:DUF4158 domain-containing protein [Streptomyces albiflaviniger]